MYRISRTALPTEARMKLAETVKIDFFLLESNQTVKQPGTITPKRDSNLCSERVVAFLLTCLSFLLPSSEVGARTVALLWVCFAGGRKGNRAFVLKELWLYLLICLVASWGDWFRHLLLVLHLPETLQDWSCFLGNVCWNNLKTYTAQFWGKEGWKGTSSRQTKRLGRGAEEENTKALKGFHLHHRIWGSGDAVRAEMHAHTQKTNNNSHH